MKEKFEKFGIGSGDKKTIIDDKTALGLVQVMDYLKEMLIGRDIRSGDMLCWDKGTYQLRMYYKSTRNYDIFTFTEIDK